MSTIKPVHSGLLYDRMEAISDYITLHPCPGDDEKHPCVTCQLQAAYALAWDVIADAHDLMKRALAKEVKDAKNQA